MVSTLAWVIISDIFLKKNLNFTEVVAGIGPPRKPRQSLRGKSSHSVLMTGRCVAAVARPLDMNDPHQAEDGNGGSGNDALMVWNPASVSYDRSVFLEHSKCGYLKYELIH